MYSLALFDNIQMPLDWYLLYFCIENDFLNPKVASEYLSRKINNNEDLSDSENDILFLEQFGKNEVLYLIRKHLNILPDFDNKIDIAKDKTKFAIITYLRLTENNVSNLLEKIEYLYANLNYPQDMESFIYYMPIDENIAKSFKNHEDYQNNLLKNIDNFIFKKAKKYNRSSLNTISENVERTTCCTPYAC